MSVSDIIEIREAHGHAPGVAAVLDTFASADPQSFLGRVAHILTPDGRERISEVEDVRDHGVTISFFFRGLTSSDVPIGSRIELDDR